MTTQFLDMALPAITEDGYPEIAEYIVNSIHVGSNLLTNLLDITSKYCGNGFLVADSNTVRLLDKATVASLDHYVIQDEYRASVELADRIKRASSSSDFLIALGSGTINDLCKCVSFEDSKEYVLFPTAPSMNGYTSPTASIICKNGVKKSIAGRLPRDIYIDTNIIASAPKRMINSGFADFICRSTARADWLLSHLLLGTEYNELPFTISEATERALLESYKGLRKGDVASVMILMQALILSGVGMIIAGGSHSASQGEHILASTTELLDCNGFLHGERVGVATVIMARLQRNLCSAKPKLRVSHIDKDTLQKHFSEDIAQEFYETLSQKAMDSAQVEHLNCMIDKNWEYLSDRVASEVINPRLLSNVLEHLDGPSLPEHMKWTTGRYKEMASWAFSTRNRFTFLDIAHYGGFQVLQ